MGRTFDILEYDEFEKEIKKICETGGVLVTIRRSNYIEENR